AEVDPFAIVLRLDELAVLRILRLVGRRLLREQTRAQQHQENQELGFHRHLSRARSFKINHASAVPPAWGLAPSPLPVSPWKYSWKSIRSFRCESSEKRRSPPWQGRLPTGPR